MFIGALFVVCMICMASIAVASEDIQKKPLDELFDQMVIIPYDYQNKAYIVGQMNDVYGDYEMYQKEGRVLVPIRLMGYLANQIETNSGHWETVWLPEKPEEVVMRNRDLDQTITFTVNSHTMLVNGQSQTLDVPPQNIEGRIVLPLRSAAEALKKKIDWLDGLILIGDHYVDLQHPQTVDMLFQLKRSLTDPRQLVQGEDRLYPLAKVNDALYFIDPSMDQLYIQLEGQQAESVLPSIGKPNFAFRQVSDDGVYFVTVENDQSVMYHYHFYYGTVHKIAYLVDWMPHDGWLGGVYSLDGEVYINLHRGDSTMGRDTLYKVEQEQLVKVADAKSFIGLEKDGEYMYYTDFNPMVPFTENLKKVNLKTGETSTIGEPGYSYGIVRTISEQSETRYTHSDSLYIHDGMLYVLGYQESDREDQNAVYKWNMEQQTQLKITPPTDQFWLLNDYIYFIDLETRHLKRVDVNGDDLQVLSEQHVLEAQLYEDQLYYKVSRDNGHHELGDLYVYEIANGQETKLSDRPVQSFYVSEDGIYYDSDGYEIGLFKIFPEQANRNDQLVHDRIDTVQLTDEGIIYTLMYEPGIFTITSVGDYEKVPMEGSEQGHFRMMDKETGEWVLVYGMSQADGKINHSFTIYNPDNKAYRLLAGELANEKGFPMTKEQFAAMEPKTKLFEDPDPARHDYQMEDIPYTSFIQGATGSWNFGFSIDQ